MNGFKSRLESVPGVESIELELGDEGLEAITVRLADDADELMVLEGVRRLLVAYGTRSPRVLATAAGVTTSSSATANGSSARTAPRHQVLDVDQSPSEIVSAPAPMRVVSSGATSAALMTAAGERVELSVTPAGDSAVAKVVLTKGARMATRQVPSSARAIVQAVLDMAAETSGREPLSVIGLNLSAIEGVRVLTVIAGNEGTTPRVSTVSVVEKNWPAALLEVASQMLEERPQKRR